MYVSRSNLQTSGGGGVNQLINPNKFSIRTSSHFPKGFRPMFHVSEEPWSLLSSPLIVYFRLDNEVSSFVKFWETAASDPAAG